MLHVFICIYRSQVVTPDACGVHVLLFECLQTSSEVRCQGLVVSLKLLELLQSADWGVRQPGQGQVFEFSKVLKWSWQMWEGQRWTRWWGGNY